MKAKARVITNIEEIEEARKLDLPNKPEIQFEEVDFYFDLNFVGYAYRWPDEIIKARIYGMDVSLIFDEVLWEAITSFLSRKH